MPPPAVPPSRLSGLDLLRSLAVVAVVLHHYPKAASQIWLRALAHYGWAGVDLFFVLSGYLIAGQLFGQARRGTPLSLGRFYARRFFRTLPNYFVVLFVFWLLEPASFSPAWKWIFFTQNFDLHRAFDYSWSLCVEEHFYLVFPFLALLLLKPEAKPEPPARTFWRGHRGLLILLAATLGGALLRYAVWRHARPDLGLGRSRSMDIYLASLYCPTYTRLDGLTAGVALAYVRSERPELWLRWRSRPRRVLALGAVFLLAAAIVSARRMSAASAVLAFPFLAVGFSAMLIYSVSEGSLIAGLRIPGVSALAHLSYAVYLTHGLAFRFAHLAIDALGASPHGLAMAGLSATAILASGGLLYLLIERPFMRLRDRYAPLGPATDHVTVTFPRADEPRREGELRRRVEREGHSGS